MAWAGPAARSAAVALPTLSCSRSSYAQLQSLFLLILILILIHKHVNVSTGIEFMERLTTLALSENVRVNVAALVRRYARSSC